MNLFHCLPGVCIGILIMALWCGGCNVTRPAVSLPPAANQGAPGRAMITGMTTEMLAENVRITETARTGATTAPLLASRLGQGPPNPPGTTITGITFEALAGRSVVSLQTAGTPPQVQVKQQHNPARLALDIKPSHLSPTQEKAMAISDPAAIVSHLTAAPVAGVQGEAVKVVVYLRTAASFEVQQESDVIRLAMTKSSTSTAAARALRMAPMSPMVRRGAAPAAVSSGTESAPAPKRSDLPTGAGLTERQGYTGEKISLGTQK